MMNKKIKVCYNSDWYNIWGKLLDGSNFFYFYKELKRIYNELRENELFIILGEQEPFWNWNFVKRFGIIGSMHETKLEVDESDMDVIVKYCRYIIVNGKIYRIDDYYDYPLWKKKYIIDGMLINILPRNMVKGLIIFRHTENKVILPDYKEMLKRLNEVNDKWYLQENLYPILLKSAGQELAVQEIVTMLMQAINRTIPSIAKEMMYKLVPKFIKALSYS